MFEFLRDLNKNNSKEWMDEHRDRYHEVRDWYIDWLNELDQKLAKTDTDYSPTEGKKAINRINNNLLYHPNKPKYKDHFGAGLDMGINGKQGDFYIHIGINGSFLASGFYKPKNEVLESIRQAIDYNGEELKKILNDKEFQEVFDVMDDGESLKTAPKGFSQDHPHIELLRKKSHAVEHSLNQKRIMKDDFQDHCVHVYKKLKPFRDYLNQAVSV
jgi:uncharacterized protein (TIGR02453 family)